MAHSNSRQNDNVGDRQSLPSTMTPSSISHGAFSSPSTMMSSLNSPFNHAQLTISRNFFFLSWWEQRTKWIQECLSKGIVYKDTTFQLPELPNPNFSHMNHAFPPPHQPASNDTVFKEENKRKYTRCLWVGDRQNKFFKVVERLGGLHEATAAKILKEMNDPELDYGNVNSHLQHERDKVAMKNKTSDQDVGNEGRKKRRIIKRESSHNSHLQNCKTNVGVENKDRQGRTSTKEETANGTKETAKIHQAYIIDLTDDDEAFGNEERIVKHDHHSEINEGSIVTIEEGHGHHVESNVESITVIEEEHDRHPESNEERIIITEEERHGQHPESNEERITIIEEEHDHYMESNEERIVIIEDDEEHDHQLQSLQEERIMIFEDDENKEEMQESITDWINRMKADSNFMQTCYEVSLRDQ